MPKRLVSAFVCVWWMSLGSPSLLRAEGLDADQAFTISRLRTHCNACHGLGKLRFLWSADDQEVWNYLFTRPAPLAKKLWATAIYEVLDWPGDKMPDFEVPIHPGKDWMPKGVKRMDLAADNYDGKSSRVRVLQTLKAHLP